MLTETSGTALQNKSDFRERLDAARVQTDKLFELVKRDALYDRPIPERHRIIFYLGHLEAFDWNLVAGVIGKPAFHPGFDHLFSFGIDPPAGQLPSDQPRDWPDESEVRAYNSRVRQELDAVLRDVPEQ